MNWFQKNFKSLIYVAFLVPILTVAFVSISHVTKWYGLSNPISWSIYLSIGIEIAALSALAAISAQMGRKVYFPFAIVTLIQFIGNIFFAYQYINIDSQAFKDWIDLVDPLVSFMGVESGDVVGHKRFLALFSGGMLPIISLSFLHMLVKFEEEEKKDSVVKPESNVDDIVPNSDEDKKYNPTEEDLINLQRALDNINRIKFSGNTEDTINVMVEVSDVTNTDNLSQEETSPSVDDNTPNETESVTETNIDDNSTDLVVSNDNVDTTTVPMVENNIEETSVSNVESESVIKSEQESIVIEPDFYKEEIPEYDIENEGNSDKKTLRYKSSR